MPEHLDFVYTNCEPEVIETFSCFHKVLYQNLALCLHAQPMSYIEQGMHDQVPLEEVLTSHQVNVKWGNLALDHVPESASTSFVRAEGTDYVSGFLISQPLALPTVFGYSYCTDPQLNLFFNYYFCQIRLYIRMSQMNIKQ